MTERHLGATQKTGISLFSRHIAPEFVMLNLLRFRQRAGCTKNLDIMPNEPNCGRFAFTGEGGYLNEPQDEQWDIVMLIRQKSVADLVACASHRQ